MRILIVPVLSAALIALTVTDVASPGTKGKSMEVTIPSPDALMARLNKGHPRLLASRQEFDRIKQQAAADAPIGTWCEKLREKARRILGEPPSRYEIPDGKRLLATSRRVLDRVYTLAFLYRLGGDTRYKERAWQELQAAADFRDWNPSHFLDTAEMTHAFAIGYDWLYDAWTPEQRGALRTAIVEKGLRPAQASYGGTGTYGWWVKAHHNWNQVCNGGIGMGTLAIGDEATAEGLTPAQAGEILHAALESLRLPMAYFAPDGAWNEGPGYWNYATAYNVGFLAALESALGTEFGFAQYPGFADTGLFPLYLTGPLGRTFNYADGGEGTIRAPQMFWLARKFGRPEYAAYQQRVASPSALDVIWGAAAERSPAQGSPTPLPLDKYFRGVEVAAFRSAWEDRDALFVGFKAGDNKANHSNLDLGTFVLDALGVRWAVDLGADNYNLPGYFGRQRWTYYRMRAEGHNTLVLNPGAEPDQDPAAAARIVRFQSRPEKAFAIADLTPAYAPQARGVRRGLALLDRRQVLVQDEVQAAQPTEVWWFLHTPAQAQVSDDGKTAMLTQENVRLQARLLSPPGATFSVMEAGPLPASPHAEGQAKNDSVRKLAVHLAGVKETRLAVLLVPLRAGEAAPAHLPAVSPLAEW
jgi:Heparinase II/III-like protein/Domain of unknown function (DUF4962)